MKKCKFLFGRHPCLKLMATTAFAIRDLNPGDDAHARRITKNSQRKDFLWLFYVIKWIIA
ncbi:hypothetical protein ACH33_05955 [Aneurinibacillus sp. XH2]|nr:hypothetical protein ACH33_05955 [Aneurinibacillus sp. XH2]